MKARTTAWQLISETFNQWLDDKAQRLGAALAYYAAFSLAPLLVIVVWIGNHMYKTDSLNEIHTQIGSVIGENAADAIVATMRALEHTPGGAIAPTLSIIALLIGATAVFGSLQDAMNTIWGVKPKARHFVLDLIRTRIFSFLMVVCFCLLLIASVAATATLAIAARYFETMYPETSSLWRVADHLLSFVLTTIIFATLYKVLPDVRLHWRDVSMGAVSTAILFTLGRIPLGMYLHRSSLSSVYGAAGSVMVLLAWVYYSAQILFMGAEFTKVYANRYGFRVRPARGAVFLTEAELIRQGTADKKILKDRRRRFA